MKKSGFIRLTGLIFTALILNACNQSQAIPNLKVPAVSPAPPVAVNDTIRFLENRIKSDPEDFIAYNKLASEYLNRMRETGDVTYLDLASRAAHASLEILPAEKNKGGLVLLAQVEYSSHNFAAARDHAQKLIELDPNKGYTYQTLGDALLELGQYDEAAAALREMEKFGGIQTLTQVAIEQRLARLAFLHGKTDDATRHYSTALKLTLKMVEPPRENRRYVSLALGRNRFLPSAITKAQSSPFVTR